MSIILLSLFGLALGSFFHVVVSRQKTQLSFVTGRSQCFSCAKQIRWYDNVPVISYGFLLGKTRCCRVRIPMHYLVVEVVGLVFLGSLGVFLSSHYVSVVQSVFLILATIVLLAVFVSDMVSMEISDWVSLWPALFFFVYSLILERFSWSTMLLGIILVAGFFLAQYLISKGAWIGGGDVRLGVLIGVLLGWKFGLVALFLAYVGGALVSVLFLLVNKKTWSSEVPFGTYLSVATFVALLWGEEILRWYVGLIG